MSAIRPSLSSLYQDAFTCLARCLSLGSLAVVCQLSRALQSKVAALPQLHRLWAHRDYRSELPSRSSPLRGLISRLRWSGSNLPSDCDRDRIALADRLPGLLLLQLSFRSDSWQDSFEEQTELCRCIRGRDTDLSLEHRSRIRTLHLRWEFGGPPAASVPPMLAVAQCLPQITDLTLIGHGDGWSTPDALLERLRSLRTLKRLALTLDDVGNDGYLSAQNMEPILSLPLLSRLELQDGWLPASCLRALLSDAAEAFRKRVVILKRRPALRNAEARVLLAELEKLCPRLTA